MITLLFLTTQPGSLLLVSWAAGAGALGCAVVRRVVRWRERDRTKI